MNALRVVFLSGLIAAVPARAVYAPLPEPKDDKNWSVSLRAGVSYDSNIFGAPTNAISSTVYTASPSISFNGSISDQTFASAGYTLTVDHFDRRPGKKTLDSHDLNARIAHAFNPTTNLDLSDDYSIAKNPESLLAGVPVNTDQSYKRNEADGKFSTSPMPKLDLTLKGRSINYAYDNANLSRQLDRDENLYGISGGYKVVPETSAVVEYRHEDVLYRTDSATKNKHSDFALVGFDYALAKKVTVTGRFGEESRTRASERDSSIPYVELSGKYKYAEKSFLAAGYVYTFEETSNVITYTDARVNRVFLNVEHALSGLLVASGSVTYEPDQLQGRRGHPNVDETSTRFGAALTWLPNPHWSVTASYDYDRVNSDDPTRNQDRNRFGISGAYEF